MSNGGSVTTAFIDLASFDEMEKYNYGGKNATAYFVRDHRKSTWFSQVPVPLSSNNGTCNFNQDWSAAISRAGDYLLQTWLRVTFPAVESADTTYNLRWTRNLMHNLIRECYITFNDLTAARFDNYFLDFWTAFTVSAGKKNGYNNMIGNFDDMRSPAPSIASYTLNLPLVFWYSRDTGIALPTAALPYNEMRINFRLRDWTDLLIKQRVDPSEVEGNPASVPTAADLVNGAPNLSNGQVWANYAIVSNDERKRMACKPRDILIEQVQTAPRSTFSGKTTDNFDIRFSHAVKLLLFGVRNTTNNNEWSNYTTASPVANGEVIDFTPSGAVDPILQTSLIYENTNRLHQMGSDYFSLVQPFYGAPVIPGETGYHMYSYSLDFFCLDPMGSTNFGKLTNVSMRMYPSAGATTAVDGSGGQDSGNDYPQTFQAVIVAVNNNIIRISGGALGFPIL